MIRKPAKLQFVSEVTHPTNMTVCNDKYVSTVVMVSMHSFLAVPCEYIQMRTLYNYGCSQGLGPTQEVAGDMKFIDMPGAISNSMP